MTHTSYKSLKLVRQFGLFGDGKHKTTFSTGWELTKMTPNILLKARLHRQCFSVQASSRELRDANSYLRSVLKLNAFCYHLVVIPWRFCIPIYRLVLQRRGKIQVVQGYLSFDTPPPFSCSVALYTTVPVCEPSLLSAVCLVELRDALGNVCNTLAPSLTPRHYTALLYDPL